MRKLNMLDAYAMLVAIGIAVVAGYVACSHKSTKAFSNLEGDLTASQVFGSVVSSSATFAGYLKVSRTSHSWDLITIEKPTEVRIKASVNMPEVCKAFDQVMLYHHVNEGVLVDGYTARAQFKNNFCADFINGPEEFRSVK